MPNTEQCYDTWSIDFISELPKSQGYNTIDKFTKFMQLIPFSNGEGALSAPESANLFFSNIIRLF